MTARTVISTNEAARILAVSRPTIVAMIRARELDGYPQRTLRAGHIHAWKVYADSVERYQARQVRSMPLTATRKGLVA